MWPEMSSCCFDSLVRENVYDSLLLRPTPITTRSQLNQRARDFTGSCLADALGHDLGRSFGSLDLHFGSGFCSAFKNSSRACDVMDHPDVALSLPIVKS